MCSISGVSFAPGSTINRHKLATALLREGEARGRDASGYAWVAPSGDGIYKKALPGGKLHVGKIPADSSAIIMHTRAATHGHESIMENNHPVVSPEGNIRLVHNGVIYNHEEIRSLLGSVGKGLPDVDSSVIPAIIEAYGLEATSELGGYAAAAWFDRETDDTIHLAKFKTSPVHYVSLWDGSFAFASTPEILGRALVSAGVAWFGNYPSPFDALREEDYLQISGGEVIAESEVSWKHNYSWSGRNYHHITSGQSTTTRGSTGSGFSNVSQPSESKSPLVVINHNDEDGETAEISHAELVSMVYAPTRTMTDEEWERWDDPRMSDLVGDPDLEGFDDDADDDEPPLGWPATTFFTKGHDGDYVTYPNHKALAANLVWTSGLEGTENHLVGPDEGPLRWVNHFADVGVLSNDGSDEVSWVRNEDSFQTYTLLFDPYVREGVQKLRQLVGA